MRLISRDMLVVGRTEADIIKKILILYNHQPGKPSVVLYEKRPAQIIRKEILAFCVLNSLKEEEKSPEFVQKKQTEQTREMPAI